MQIFSFIGTHDGGIYEKIKNKQVQLFIHQTMCLKRIEKKKLFRTSYKKYLFKNLFTPLQNGYLITF